MIRGSKRSIKAPNNLNVRATIHNRFDIEVVDAATGKVKQVAQALNVVCDNLWARLFTPATYFNYIFYGRGTGTPSASDNSLFSHIGYGAISGSTYEIDYSTGIYKRKGSIQLAAATAAGETISEVGIGYGTGASNLCTHAMLQDMNGNPVSIDKTDRDVINIYATIYVHFKASGYDNGSIIMLQRSRNTTNNGTSIDLFSWFSGAYVSLPNVAYWAGGDTLDFVEAYNSKAEVPNNLSPLIGANWNLSASSKTATLNLDRLEASAGNLEQGLILVSIGGGKPTEYWHMRYHVPNLLVYSGGNSFPYSEVYGESVGTGDGSTKDFALDFAFPHDVKVYVDGVETTDFTVDYAPNTTDWRPYMRSVRAESRVGNLIPNPINRSAFWSAYLYNPMWEIGIESMTFSASSASSLSFKTSDDGENWEQITPTVTSASSGYIHTIPEAYRHKKFWKVEVSTGIAAGAVAVTPPSTFTGKCLHLDTPPPEGAVITADYKCDCFAKDANHVLDMSVTFQFNEYTE